MKRMAYPSSMPLVNLNQSIRLLAFGRLHCSLFFSFKPADQEDWSQTGIDEQLDLVCDVHCGPPHLSAIE